MGRTKIEKAPGELDPVAKRLMDFVIEKGGPSPVATKMGKHPQLFYNIRDGASKPSMDTLREVKLSYPDLDLDWIIMGTIRQVPIEATVSPVNGVQLVPAMISSIDYKSLFEGEREETIRLRQVNERLSMSILEKAGLLTDKEHSKLESGSWTTVKEIVEQQQRDWNHQERKRIGYEQAYMRRTAKVVSLYPNPVMRQLLA